MANDQANPKPLLTAIGARLRTLRETAGRRQEDVAFAARRWGFPWTRIAVAQIELGRRRVSVEEWLLLPAILQEALGCSVTWADLMPIEERCALNRETWAWPPFLSHLVDRQGQVAVEDEELIERPVTRQIRALNAMEVLGRRLWPHGAPLETIQAAASAAQGEAERKAAYTLRATPQAVALAAIRAWGRSLTAERDARLADGPTSARSRQAFRGHVTRTLYKELQPVLGMEQPGKEVRVARRAVRKTKRSSRRKER
jgi:transcriptional regulator with XRE-family HTH domain